MLGNIFLAASASALLLLGLIVLFSNRRKALNWYLALMIFGGFGWVIANLAINLSASVELALWLTRSTFLWVGGLSYFFVLFSYSFALQRPLKKSFVVAGAIPFLVCLVIAPTGLGIASVTPYGRETVSGPGYAVLLATVVLYLCIGLLRMVLSYRHSSAHVKSQYEYIFLGIGLSFIPGLIFDGLLVAIGNNDFAAIGPGVVTVFMAFTTVAMIRHRFFNVRVLVARSVTFVVLLAGLGFLYAGALLGVSNFILKSGRTFGIDSFLEIILTLVLAFTFQPLRSFVERITNGIFYRDHYDSQEVLNNFSKILVSELDLDRILKRSLQTLTDSVHIQYAQIVVFNNDRVYRIDHVGPVPKRLMIAPELAKLNHPMIIADELEGERKATLEEHGIRVSLTLRTAEEFVGYLLLGDKLSGDIYSTQDIQLLEIIGKELAVAILNAKAYAEIQAFNLTLQARVDHATNRLRVANRHLKELDHAKDEFISMASHQLRTPLTTIKGYLSMLQEGDAGKLSDAQIDFVNYAFGASERMVNLISDLLNVSRLSAGRFLIQSKPTDMIQMVADEVRQLQTHAAAKNISLIFVKPEGEFPVVELDDNKTRQVVMNFIDNAIYYTQEGEVRVLLEKAGDDHVRLEVRDTGIGVPRVAQKKLFSKFFRAENAQIVRPDGTGLGLYLAKRVVEDQGGTIIFSSVEGKGSTFGFELPIKPSPPVTTGKAHARH